MNKKILLIDDEELVVKSIEKLLRKEGYVVVSVRDGESAIRKVADEDFNLIVTDIRMPQIDGIETITKIRELRRKKGKDQIPEICITGYAEEEVNKKAEVLGVADYLFKPFDLRDFLACVKKHITA